MILNENLSVTEVIHHSYENKTEKKMDITMRQTEIINLCEEMKNQFGSQNLRREIQDLKKKRTFVFP